MKIYELKNKTSTPEDASNSGDETSGPQTKKTRSSSESSEITLFSKLVVFKNFNFPIQFKVFFLLLHKKYLSLSEKELNM